MDFVRTLRCTLSSSNTVCIHLRSLFFCPPLNFLGIYNLSIQSIETLNVNTILFFSSVLFIRHCIFLKNSTVGKKTMNLMDHVLDMGRTRYTGESVQNPFDFSFTPTHPHTYTVEKHKRLQMKQSVRAMNIARVVSAAPAVCITRFSVSCSKRIQSWNLPSNLSNTRQFPCPLLQ